MNTLSQLLGEKASYYLDHQCQTIPSKHLHLPGPDFVERSFGSSNRNPKFYAACKPFMEMDA